jgi:hypothetical protein
MRALIAVFAAVVPLAAEGEAAAKGAVSAKVCGPSDCRTVADEDALVALNSGGPPAAPPAEATGYYEVRITIAAEREIRETFPAALLPGAGLIRGGDAEAGYAWMSLPRRSIVLVRRLTSGLAPFPAASLEGIDAPKAQVDEVALPRAEAQADPGGGPGWPWVAGGGAVVLLALALLAARVGGASRPAASP